MKEMQKIRERLVAFKPRSAWDKGVKEIAETFCTPSELRRTDFGRKDPNSRETWMDVQVRAHVQAWALIKSCM